MSNAINYKVLGKIVDSSPEIKNILSYWFKRTKLPRNMSSRADQLAVMMGRDNFEITEDAVWEAFSDLQSCGAGKRHKEDKSFQWSMSPLEIARTIFDGEEEDSEEIEEEDTEEETTVSPRVRAGGKRVETPTVKPEKPVRAKSNTVDEDATVHLPLGSEYTYRVNSQTTLKDLGRIIKQLQTLLERE